MNHIKSYKVFESSLSKNEIVEKIKFYSKWIRQYLEDYNNFTRGQVNLHFSYNTALTIREIFELTDKLNNDSENGLIRSVANEFIKWSEYFTEEMWGGMSYKTDQLREFPFEYNYMNYTHEFKENHRWNFYNSDYKDKVYAYVGREIKRLISGTIWDIPQKKKFTKEDEQFLLDSIISDLDVHPQWVENVIKNGLHIMKYDGSPITQLSPKLDYDSDFIIRLQSFFGGVLIISNHKIYLPFYFILSKKEKVKPNFCFMI